MKYKNIVQNWHYDDGWSDVPHILRKKGEPIREFDEHMVGWHCWVYPESLNKQDFQGWMSENMKGEYDCDYRFNSGDPMFTVQIKDPEDATLFKLRWM